MKESLKRFILHSLLPFCYRLSCATQKTPETVLFLEIRYEGLSDNLALLKAHYDRQGSRKTRLFCLLTGQGGLFAYTMRCIRLMGELAGASVVFVDESSDVLAALPIRKQTKVVQCWHACGAFKRFGHGIPGGLKEEYYGPYDFVTVSSQDMIPYYAEAMNQPKEKVLALGVSRTDRFHDKAFLEGARKRVLSEFPEIQGKKVVLYAPTFRGNVARAKNGPVPDATLLKQRLGDRCVVLYKAHPAIARTPEVDEGARDFWIDVSKRAATEELLCAADLCITDYSSLIFEYALLERPILFFAPDLSEYLDVRGFYHTIEQMDAGDVFKDSDALADAILAELSQEGGIRPETLERVRRFREKFMGSCDGHATERIVKEVGEG
ncbi:MAG: CDP-glycerol glycerophosphotransferase family protein [Lachnospiraceae bacterium]|nr:CDP-glycerol glycerophosphotransferase family protein [Lachnospiraceae bacterium]